MTSKLPALLVIALASFTLLPHATAQNIDWSAVEEDAQDADRAVSVKISTTAQLGTRIESPTVRVAYEEFYIATLRHRLAVFAWQALAAKIIFAVVITLVLSGLLLAALQFYLGLRRGSSEVTQELELSLQGVKVRSQFLGVITLALSLAFFYLYLSTVYPVMPVGQQSKPAEQAK
jgi:hypothetical protein